MREYLLVLLVAAAVSYLLTPLVRRAAVAIGAVRKVRDRDVHAVPTPTLGGFAMYGGLAAGLLVASQLPIMRGVLVGKSALSLLLAGALIVASGFVDDRWGMNATSKLAAQVAAGGILVWGGVELAWLPVPKSTVVLSPGEGAVLTILLVVVTVNAVNFIDGLDGLAAGIVGISAFAFFAYSYEITRMVGGGQSHLTLPALSSALLTGMCAGFLPHNFFPARIFMGDTGAMLLGLVLAYGPVASSDNLDPSTLTHINRFPAILPLLIPVLILVIPYADLILAVVRRTRAGVPWNAADKKHLHHRLLDIGHSHRQSVLIMYAWAALFAFAVVMLGVVRSLFVVFAATTLGAILALVLVSMPQLRPAWLGGDDRGRRRVRHGSSPRANSHRPHLYHRPRHSQAEPPTAGPSAKV